MQSSASKATFKAGKSKPKSKEREKVKEVHVYLMKSSAQWELQVQDCSHRRMMGHAVAEASEASEATCTKKYYTNETIATETSTMEGMW